ncbi:hypothetical protein JCM17846_08580 [Iodidimonas nitroreducens]|uniref:Band 7 domain-containing protein n=1 Tax=Iodidimonas nitroreducens TaxID=1236968 RepID=A0A5A7N857_9PROT|nr:protease modulator HflC [Iodidimonas nitroreducens]GER03176.1 hypothetical protein JCM17846_08580 [Iodidimonas nitroreducens]
MNARSIFLLIVLGVVIAIASTGLFTVRETEQVIVMQFGDPRRVVKEPGLHWKLPFLQQANYFDSRILNLDIDTQEVIASDQKRLQVDAFTRFRITDPLLTYQTVRNELGAKSRIDTIVASNLRQVLASEPLRNIVSGERAKLMERIREQVNLNADRFGVEVVDMRLRRVDLPDANSQTIFDRMRTEREREAEEARAEGRELAARIRRRLIANALFCWLKPAVKRKSCGVKAMGLRPRFLPRLLARMWISLNSTALWKPIATHWVINPPPLFCHRIALFLSILVIRTRKNKLRLAP